MGQGEVPARGEGGDAIKRDITLTSAEWADICAMRAAQKVFFSTRRGDAEHQQAIIDARPLEKKLDALIKQKNDESQNLELPMD